MNKIFFLLIAALLFFADLVAQKTFDDYFPKAKMKKDLALFIDIRKKANSGLYKYRNKAEIDSLHQQAFEKINHLNTYGDFFNLISDITAFEGSCHNGTGMKKKIFKRIESETTGYFPYPIKMFGKEVRINFDGSEIPLGGKILSINGIPIESILKNISKYAETDGNNSGGKKAFFDVHFSKYIRYSYGKQHSYEVDYVEPNTNKTKSIVLQSIGYTTYYKNYDNRYYGKVKAINDGDDRTKYAFKMIDKDIGMLSIHTFSIDDTDNYQSFLDSCLSVLELNEVGHLIVDIRRNGGGYPPHDLLSLSSFASAPHKEIKSAWVSMRKIPYWKHFKYDVPFFLRPIARIKLNKELKKSLPIVKENGYYYRDIIEYPPHKNAYKGKIYLLIGPDVASAASIFASMMVSYTNAISVGEETIGGYYGQNSVFPFVYELPKSKIRTVFSIANLEHDVVKKETQFHNRGMIPDINVPLSLQDFFNKKDTQLNYVIQEMIGKTDYDK